MNGILSEVGRVRAAEGGGRYVMERSLVWCSANNGIVDRATQSVEHQVTVLKSAVGEPVESEDRSEAPDCCPMACRGCCGALDSLRGRTRRSFCVREIKGKKG